MTRDAPDRLHRERLLYIPNEQRGELQSGPRAAFEALAADGDLGGYTAFPLEAALRKGGASAFDELREEAAALRPTAVLWQHPGDAVDVPRGFVAELRALGERPVVIHHEGDVYGWLRKRPPAATRRLVRDADLVFTVGLGSYARLLRLLGATALGYVPNCVEPARFDWGDRAVPPPEFAVSMIGNRVTSDLHPFPALPGAVQRSRLAHELGLRLGDDFALFGAGWEGFAGWRGPLPFDEQTSVAVRSRLTVSWDHFDRTPYFFSNRLPISLLSGVAHVTNRQPGYEELFVDGHELFLVDSVEQGVKRVMELLDGPSALLERVGAAGRRLARRCLSFEEVFPRMLRAAVGYRDGRGALPAPRTWMRSE